MHAQMCSLEIDEIFCVINEGNLELMREEMLRNVFK